MRRKAFWVLLMVMGGVIWGGIQSVTVQAKGEDSCFGEDSYLLKAPEGVEAKRAPVKFPHQGHFGFACVQCHHTFDGSEPPMGCTVSGCHDVTEPERGAGKADSWDNNEYYKTAYHKTCWLGCHKEIKAKNWALQRASKGTKVKLEKSGPTTCNGCHSRAAVQN